MKLGRKWAKQTFHLTENDFIDLEIAQKAYLAGYNRCMRDNLTVRAIELKRRKSRL